MAGTTQEIAERRAAAPRSNVMLVATLSADGSEAAVRVRNLSESGALIEGATLPPAATEVRLFRNNLSVTGSIVWSSGGRAGLRFASLIDTKPWTRSGTMLPAPSAEQARVDTIQAAARAGLPTPPPRSLPDGPRPNLAAAMPSRIVEELAYVRRLVESIGDELANEPVFVCRHSAALQKFDLAAQILGQLGTVLLADDQVAAAEKIGQQELRARLLRKA
jgi:hypothetical protein